MPKHLTMFLSTVLVLAVIMVGCSQQGDDIPAMEAVTIAPTVSDASTETTEPEPTSVHSFVPSATEEETVPTATEDNSGSTDPSSDSPEVPEVFDPSIPEDTRPPIEVTLPDETKPYTSFEAYNDMTEAEQKEFYDSFENPDDFFAWYNEAKAEYEEANPPVIIDGSTNIEIVP